MKGSEEKLTYFILVLGLLLMSAFLGYEIYQSTIAQGTETTEEGEDGDQNPSGNQGNEIDPSLFTKIDRFAPILTPVPTLTPIPTPTPAPTQVPFAEGWKVKLVAGPMAIILDGKNGDKQHTVRLNEIYDEDFVKVPEPDYNSRQRGTKFISFDGPNKKAMVRNYDGREKEVPAYQSKTPER